MRSYDLLIIGGGPAGYRAAEFAAHAGLKTCVIEKNVLGGVCLNVGCIPTKSLLKSAKVAKYVEHAADYGIVTDTTKIVMQWDKMQERKVAVVKKLVDGVGLLLKANKVDLIKGEATFVDANNVTVNGEQVGFKNLLVGTGSLPFVLPLPGFEEAFKKGKMLDSTGILSLPKIPKTLTVIGGGVIGVEFACLFADLGTKVTIIQGLDTILEKLDREVSAEAAKFIKDKGVEIVLNAKVTGYDLKKDVLNYEIDGKPASIKGDYTLLAVGRKPVTGGVEKIGVALDKRGSIIVDDVQRTNLPHVYAAGDCCSPIMLAHVAYKHASVIINNIVGAQEKINYDNIPSCIYTSPEVAFVGKTEEELKAANIPYIKSRISSKIVGKVLADGDETYGFTKFLVSPKYGEILGCHIVASTASDLIAEVVTLLDAEATIYELARSIHPHPTVSEMVGDCAIDAVYKLKALKEKQKAAAAPAA